MIRREECFTPRCQQNEIAATGQRQCAAVEYEVILRNRAPLPAGVMAVVMCAGFIDALNALGRVGRGEVIVRNGVLCAVDRVGVNEYVETIVALAQYVIGTAPDNDAGLFLREFLNDVALEDVDFIHRGECVGGMTAVVVGDAHVHIEQAAAGGGIFARFLDEFQRKSALLCDQSNEAFVIAGNAQFLRHHFGDCAPAASKLAADRDDTRLHAVHLPLAVL